MDGGRKRMKERDEEKNVGRVVKREEGWNRARYEGRVARPCDRQTDVSSRA